MCVCVRMCVCVCVCVYVCAVGRGASSAALAGARACASSLPRVMQVPSWTHIAEQRLMAAEEVLGHATDYWEASHAAELKEAKLARKECKERAAALLLEYGTRMRMERQVQDAVRHEVKKADEAVANWDKSKGKKKPQRFGFWKRYQHARKTRLKLRKDFVKDNLRTVVNVSCVCATP